jgi:hypothetical protein
MPVWAILSLQGASAALTLATGLVALRVANRVHATHPIHAVGWWVAGLTFTAAGVSDVISATWAAAAVSAGPETVVYSQYLRWATSLNQSRTGIEIALGIVLLGLALRNAGWERVRVAAPWVLAAGMAGGAIAGLPVLEFDASTYADLAIANGIEFTALAVALVAALLRGSLDWMLWVLILVRMISQAINMLILVTMMWFRTEGVWFVSSSVLQSYLTGVVALMLGLAVWRLSRARRGIPVHAVLDRFRERDDRSMALPRRTEI